MGSTSFYPEEAPIHTVSVGPLAVERHPVTNAQFAEFVTATGYVTVAEQPIDPALYPGADPGDLCPGAMVFRPTPGPVDLRDWRQWWDWVPGANWRHPFGPDSPDSIGATGPITRSCRWRIPTPRPTHGGPGGGCRPRPSGSMRPAAKRGGHVDLFVGRGGETRRSVDGQHLAGQVPVPQRRCARLGGNVAGWDVSAQRFRLGRHDRQRLGVDRHRVLRAPPARSAAESLLHTVWTGRPERQPDVERWFALVRAGVLPPLPSGGAVAAIARHRDHAHRLSLRSYS